MGTIGVFTLRGNFKLVMTIMAIFSEVQDVI